MIFSGRSFWENYEQEKKPTAWIFVIYYGIFSYIVLVNLENNNSTQLGWW